MTKKCNLSIANGTVKVGALPVVARKDSKGRLWIADMDGYAVDTVPVCGCEMRVRVIVKVFCEPKTPREKMAVEKLHRTKKQLKRR